MFLGEYQSRIYPHMRAKFYRGPTAVSKRGGGYRHTYYETVTSMSGTILPTMYQLFFMSGTKKLLTKNVSNLGGNPVTQLIVNVYQMIKL